MLLPLHIASKAIPPLLISLFLPQTLALPRDNGLAKLVSGRRVLASCTFEIAEKTFDLCPLFGKEVFAVEDRRAGAGATLSTATSSPSTPALVWDGDESLGQAPRRVPLLLGPGQLQFKTVKGRKRPCNCLWDDDRQALNLLYVPADNSAPSAISFICDASLPSFGSLGSLIQSSTSEGGHFVWRTRHACPNPRRPVPLTTSEILTVAEEEAASPEDGADPGAEGDSDLLKPHKPTWRTSRKWIAGFLGIFALASLFLALASLPRVRFFVLQRIHALISMLFSAGSRVAETVTPLKVALASVLPASLHFPFTFRQGDQRLVQWAEEEMGLQEDFVNGDSGTFESQLEGDEWNGRNLDEYIPLTLSPKRGGKVRSYGSTPLRETFSEYVRR